MKWVKDYADFYADTINYLLTIKRMKWGSLKRWSFLRKSRMCAYLKTINKQTTTKLKKQLTVKPNLLEKLMIEMLKLHY